MENTNEEQILNEEQNTNEEQILNEEQNTNEDENTCVSYQITINNVSVNNGKKYYLYKIVFSNPCLEVTKTYFGEKVTELNEQFLLSDEELKTLYSSASTDSKIINGSFSTL
jgi:hypothetical protein